MQEKWTRWEPISNLSEKYYLESITDDSNGFKILLSTTNFEKKIIMHFKNSVKAYRRTDETFSLFTLDQLNKNNDIDYYAKWSFFKVENSEYLEWLNKQSFGISQQFDFIHFCILGANEMIDIAASYEPEVRHVD